VSYYSSRRTRRYSVTFVETATGKTVNRIFYGSSKRVASDKASIVLEKSPGWAIAELREI
jgi:hypothetical protein